jgi:L-asparaginase
MAKRKVAVIGTGGTISSIGAGPFDTQDYGATGIKLHVDELLARFPDLHELADIILVQFSNVISYDLHFPQWKQLVEKIDALLAEHRDLDGIVITHGTATMEETAYFLSLTADLRVPVVLTGSQRPASALSSDAGMNLAGAIRTAGAPEARGLGVLVVMNDEIHCARDVTKSSTYRLHAFRSPDFGILGHVDGDAVAIYRRPARLPALDDRFSIKKIDALPRVDIAYAYAGSDGTAVRAMIEAGARGIVSAGFAPGSPGSADAAILAEAVAKKGLIVVQSTRAGSGRTSKTDKLAQRGFLTADNLNPQKARILLALALTKTSDPSEIEQSFQTF